MARRRDDDAVAVAEPARTPAEIVAAAAAETNRLRHDKLVTAVERWRELTRSIEAGQEPAGQELAELAQLADDLAIPPDGLASSVAAITRERRLAESVAELSRQAKEAAVEEPELQRELVALETRHRELQSLYQAGRQLLHSLALESNNLGNYRREYPLLFGDASMIADRVIERDARGGAMSLSTGRLS
jgi:chromosome segregation ATPase